MVANLFTARFSRRNTRCLPWIKLTPDIWNIDALPIGRQQRINNSPAGAVLITKAAEQARAPEAPIPVGWEPAIEAPGFFRVKARIGVSEELFDWIFNGPAGYRAHYYFHPDSGERFNRQMVLAIGSAIQRRMLGLVQIYGSAVLKSLEGKWSKIWVGDNDAFGEAPENQLRPQRWVDNNEPFKMGLRAPLPPEPAIELIGTWINPMTNEFWLSPDKENRSQDLNLRGFA
jgi:hypothetical protein